MSKKTTQSGIKAGPFSIYDMIGIMAILFAFIVPDTAYITFISSVFQIFAAFGTIPAPDVSNQQFTILEMRAMLIIFGVLFLVPHILSFMGVGTNKGGRR